MLYRAFQLCVASTASAERMQVVEDILAGSKRALEELKSNLSKIRALQAVAAHVMDDVERDSDVVAHNKFNCAGKQLHLFIATMSICLGYSYSCHTSKLYGGMRTRCA